MAAFSPAAANSIAFSSSKDFKFSINKAAKNVEDYWYNW
jgi:hypothetical protein